jgi:hypothetical protein
VYTPTPEEKKKLDELHKRKIDQADEVLVLNVGGYIGSSTQSEIDYAREKGKRIRYLEQCKHPNLQQREGQQSQTYEWCPDCGYLAWD